MKSIYSRFGSFFVISTALCCCGSLHAQTSVVGWGLNTNGQTRPPAGLTNAVAVVAGGYHTLALLSDGTVRAWGAGTNVTPVPPPNFGQSLVPAGLSNVVAISAGLYTSLALLSNGTIRAWGRGFMNGGFPTPPWLSNVIAISSGVQHDLAVRNDGSVVGWGFSPYGQTNAPPWLKNAFAVAAGGNHSLALRGDGTVVAWGNNSYGQTNVPASLTNVIAIAAGTNHSLVLSADGTVTAWGDNSQGQTNVPPSLSNVLAIAAGYFHNLALKSDGSIVAWGDGSAGQTTVPPAATNTMSIAAGFKHSVALTGMTAPFVNGASLDRVTVASLPLAIQFPIAGSSPINYQWAFNGLNLAGATNSILSLASVQFNQLGTYTVAASNVLGTATASVRLSAYQVAGWGYNYDGELNVSLGMTNIVQIAAGNTHSLALRSDGTVVAWGGNWGGQANVPPGLSNVVEIAGGYGHSAALKSDGTVLAWGDNSYGATNVPPGLSNVVAIAAGFMQNIALKADGTVAAWGFNATNMPVDLTNIVGVAATARQYLALRADGSVLLWIGGGVPADLTNAVALAGAAAVSVGHVLALRAVGTVATINFILPHAPASLTNAIVMSAGEGQDLAVRADGTLVVWPDMPFGGTNPPAGLTRLVSVAAGERFGLALIGNGPPFLTSPLVDRTVAYGLPCSLYTSATGSWPLSYRWQFNGADLPGATNQTLTLNPTFEDAGSYSVVVTNSFGTVSSPPLMLRVVPELIQVQPQSQTNVLGSTVTLSVSVSGQGLTYQWEFNGVPLDGATNSTLVLTNVQLNQAGNYTVVIRNAEGEVTSRVVPVFVEQVAVWGDNSHGQTNLVGTATNLIGIAAGGYHELAVAADGSVTSWGYNSAGQATVPAGLTNVISAAAGEAHSIALLSDGTVIGWGDNSAGQATPPAALSNVVALASGPGAYHSAALRSDGTVVVWGDNSQGETNVPPDLTNAVALAVAGDHCLALRADGTVAFWGDASYSINILPDGLTNVVAIATSLYHCMALKAEGTLIEWGVYWNNNFSYAYGVGTPPSLTNIAAIAVGYDHDIALLSDGSLTTWGPGRLGQTNDPPFLQNVGAIAANDYDTVALVETTPPVFQALLQNALLDTNGFSVSYPTRSGRVYALEYKNSLTDTAWTPLPLVAGNGAVQVFHDSTVRLPQRFYRIRQW